MKGSPFNLNAFLSGQPAITSDGRKVQFISLLPENVPARLFVGVRRSFSPVLNNFTRPNWDENGYVLENFFVTGKYYSTSSSDLDLVMADPL